MHEAFKIFAQQMQNGDEEKIDAYVTPEFMEVHEAELAFEHPVLIQGNATRLDNDLILRLCITTAATMPCAICNQNVQVKISIPDFYHTETIRDLKSGIFNFCVPLREAILLEVPMTTECCSGKCPERKNLEKFQRREDDSSA